MVALTHVWRVVTERKADVVEYLRPPFVPLSCSSNTSTSEIFTFGTKNLKPTANLPTKPPSMVLMTSIIYGNFRPPNSPINFKISHVCRHTQFRTCSNVIMARTSFCCCGFFLSPTAKTKSICPLFLDRRIRAGKKKSGDIIGN